MSYDTTILAESGLVSYWKVDETTGIAAADSKGTNNGTYTGGYTLGQAGISGNAVLLDGSTGYITVPDATNLHITTSITVEAWVKPATATTGLFSRIVSKPAAATVTAPFNDYALEMSNAAGNFGFDLSIGNTQKGVSGGPTILAGAWYHVVGTYDSATMKLYVDGALVASAAQTGAIDSRTQPFQIGRLIGGNYVNGTIDAVAIYNTALSATQVGTHYLIGHYGVGTGGRTSGDGADASFNFGTTNPLAGATSLLTCCWINVGAWNQADQALFSQSNGSSTGWQLKQRGSTSSITYNEPGTGGFGATDGVNRTNGNWIHVAGYHGSGFNYLYINGTNIANSGNAGSNPFSGAGQALTVGLPSPALAIAEPALFKGLTQAQANTITANLAAGRSPMAQTPAPVFYSRFGGGTTETDQVGGLTSTLPSNSYAVAGPTVDAPPSSFGNPAAMMMHL